MTCQPNVYPEVVSLGLFFKTYIAEFAKSVSKCLVHFREDSCISYRWIDLPTFPSAGM